MSGSTSLVSSLRAMLPKSDETWLIRKDGYFYRANYSGYTTEKSAAGRYTEEEARREAAVEPHNMKAIPASEVPDPPVAISAEDARELLDALEASESTASKLRAERDETREALRPFAAIYERLIPDRGDWGLANHPDDLSDDSQALAFPRLGDIRRARSLLTPELTQNG
jgi:hypothetical protein